MIALGRIASAVRVDLVLGGLGWLTLLGMAHAERVAELVGGPGSDAFPALQSALVAAFVVFSCLSWRFVRRLYRAGRRVTWDPAQRATQGTVMAEFVLVLPIVLLLLGTVFQIALIANAALVVRYAAFVAARSAIVSFEADLGKDLAKSPGSSLTSMFQMPFLPEWVDKERPTDAATMVLAAISPRTNSTTREGLALQSALEANGKSWGKGNFARRMPYAIAATTVTTIRDKHAPDGVKGDLKAWHESFSPLIPEPEHAVQPARQKEHGADIAYLLPAPPKISDLIPDSIPVQVEIPLPKEATLVLDTLHVDRPTVTVDVPLKPAKKLAKPLTDQMDAGIETMRTGSASKIRAFARSPANIDVFAPKEVEITLTYLFKLDVPSFVQLAPGVTQAAPLGKGRAFKLKHPTHYTVRLQSTGGRRTLLGAMWKVPDVWALMGGSAESVDNTILYWRPREIDEDQKKADKKRADADKKKKNADKKNKEAADKQKEADKKNKDAADKKKDAEKKQKEADEAKAKAEAEEDAKKKKELEKDAEAKQEEADQAKKDADKAEKEAEKANKEAEKAAKEAEKANKEAKEAETEAQQAEKDAKKAKNKGGG